MVRIENPIAMPFYYIKYLIVPRTGEAINIKLQSFN